MLYISTDTKGDSVINLTAGDDATIDITLTNDDGTAYEIGEREYLVFSVREKPVESSELLLELESEQGSTEISFTHDATADINPGYYSAEVQLMTEDGKRITVWPKLTGSNRTSQANRRNFCLMTEVVFR